MVDIKERKVIPKEVAKDILGVGNAEFTRLLAARVLDVKIETSGRGNELRTDLASIERALRHVR